MRTLALLVFLSIPCLAQTQGFAPQPVDSFQDAGHMNGGTGACSVGSGSCVNFTEGVNNNDLIVCGAGGENPNDGCAHGPITNPPWTFSDTASFTWTMETFGGNTGNQSYGQMGYACAGSTQATYRVTFATPTTGCVTNFNCARFKNACTSGTITTDGFNQAVAATTSAPGTTVSSSITTTRLRDLVVSLMQTSPGNGNGNREQASGAMSPIDTLSQTYADLGWEIAPTLGSNTFSWIDYFSTNNSTQTQSLAFKIPIIIGDSALPEGGNGTAYSAQLHCYGGTSGTPTYALASGSFPSGVTLNTSTGLISGTPGANGTFNVGFTCTDGTSTSSTRSLSMVVVANLPTPQIMSTANTNLSGGGGTISVSGTACGDVIVLQAQAADDTHGGQGYLQSLTGSGNFVSSSDGSPVAQYLFGGGTFNGPVIDWVVGPLNTGGVQTINVANSTSSSSALLVQVTNVRGVQAALSSPALNSEVYTTNTATIAATYTTVVPNELVMASTVSNGGAANVTGMTFNSPLSLATFATDQYIAGGWGSGLIASPTSVTATTNISTTGTGGCGAANVCFGASTLVTSLRPGTDTACAAFSGSGEKHHRIIN